METIEEWWKTRMAKDIHNTLRARERQLPKYHAQSPQLHLRRYLVDWLAVISDSGNLHLCSTALHLAVSLLDRFMDKFDIEENQLHLVALTCLMIAAKFEERDIKIPEISRLNKYVDNSYKWQDFLQMELLLLNFFSWNVCQPTASHYIEYYIQECISENDIHAGQPLRCPWKAKIYMEKYAHYFLEISLQDHAFVFFHPSLISAACIAASRICLLLSPSWTKKLIKFTKYSWDEIAPCIDVMLKAHDSDEKACNRKTTPIVNHNGYNRGYAVRLPKS
ncbi:cyclin-J-like [Saccoglossus kowalevskii]|uniref:Cyclin-J-like n=1 Tax=Saccoglossus kowalevskii TaxID=10224 RepID=A0ABM0GTT0_SACKO|nr:PREDICTED: cyclin-J-like [Saccoglossus kowalevskii]